MDRLLLFLANNIIGSVWFQMIHIFIFKKKESMHSIAMNTLNACFSTNKATRQELLQEEEHSDLHQSIQCFD